ncbi:YihY/virulence factor BrkB family protein [Streptomyces sp. NPDC006879]|uniref:YihY/virulence factor BrkB family protein n=1 Tax=Streptomyces sp. NPDC006879 TaxID=3364767 RepID=UPI0036C01750
MDWLAKLPVVGSFVAWLMRTHAWRSYERLDRVKWSRLAAAVTFISFIAVFPLITVAAAIGAALLSPSQLDRMEEQLAEQVPGISEQLDIGGLVDNAGTVGLVAGAVLLFAGIGWIGSMRDCLRAVWDKDQDDEGNPIVRKGKDALVLFGLGGAGLVSAAASVFGQSAVGKTADWLGIPSHGAGGVLLRGAALAVSVLAGFLLLMYVLTLLPGVHPPRRRLLTAALIGAVGFELLKLLLGGYMRGVAAKSMYGAFGVPIALLLWINFMAKVLLFCAAWTATDPVADSPEEDEEKDSGRTPAPGSGPAVADSPRSKPGQATARQGISGRRWAVRFRSLRAGGAGSATGG